MNTNKQLQALVTKYGAPLKAIGVSNEEMVRFLAQCVRMLQD